MDPCCLGKGRKLKGLEREEKWEAVVVVAPVPIVRHLAGLDGVLDLQAGTEPFDYPFDCSFQSKTEELYSAPRNNNWFCSSSAEKRFSRFSIRRSQAPA
jgi:hypothetical protein